MSKISQRFTRSGDKENSPYFEEYIEKIYLHRESLGLDELITGIRAFVVQVNHGDALKYLGELYLMTPYRFTVGYQSSTHRAYILQIKPEYPAYIVLEPLTEDYYDLYTAINSRFPRAKDKINARYIGEIFNTKNTQETVKLLKENGIRFQTDVKNQFTGNPNFVFSEPSYYTNNCIGYTDSALTDFDALNLGEKFTLTAEQDEQLSKSDKLQRHFGMFDLIHGIDHMATRVLSGEREDAILELLMMTNYYFWGAYSISDMNSSTNICRNPNVDYELYSPAKVFTANNTPFYVQGIDKLPSPTEDFVRNFGKRMHHIAYEVQDGEQEGGLKNIDYVVEKLISSDIPFLAQIIGECKDFPDLKQIFSKSSTYSLLITEYVQRCQGYEGFFAKENVAYLTQAAGLDEQLEEQRQQEGTFD